MKLGKKHIVLTALAVALGAAVFLNWQFADNDALLAATTKNSATTKELGKAQYANANTSLSNSEDSSDSASQDTDVIALDKESREYFEDAKDARDDAQEQVVEIATNILESAEADDAARTQAVASAAEIAEIIQKQANIENLIKAKGFTECMVYIQNDQCNIVLNKGVLSEALAVAIKDIVSSQAGITFENISITEV